MKEQQEACDLGDKGSASNGPETALYMDGGASAQGNLTFWTVGQGLLICLKLNWNYN